jgi:hypothetical protein
VCRRRTENTFAQEDQMPYRTSINKAIKDEEAAFQQHRIMLIAVPSIVLLCFIGFSGAIAVRLLHAPELFSGMFPETPGYGILVTGFLFLVTNGRPVSLWLNAWTNLHIRYHLRIEKLQAVLASLEAQNEAPPPPAAKPWTPSPIRPERKRALLPSELLPRAKDDLSGPRDSEAQDNP